MVKYSIVLPIYKDRKAQLKYALKAYAEQTYSKHLFELIIVDQGNDENIEELFNNYGLRIKYIKVDLNKVGYGGGMNPSYAQNVAFRSGEGEYFILTSPEVCFENEALEKIDRKINPNIFLYCCVTESDQLDYHKIFEHNYLANIRMPGMPFNGWLSHPKYRRDLMSYFMAVIHKDVIFKIQGVDEDFMKGVGYEDNDFGKRVSICVNPVFDDTIIGAHLQHSRQYQKDFNDRVDYACTLWMTKERMGQYPLVANTNRIWGNNEGIVSTVLYNNSKINGEDDLITVFTSCHNQGKYLRQAIESVLNQTYSTIEYLLYDDGSTDNTWDIIQEYALKDYRIKAFKLEKQANVGVVINKSISEMKGNFWVWCPSDDILRPYLLEEKYKNSTMFKHDCVLYSNWIHIDENGEDIGHVSPRPMTPHEFSKEVWETSPIGFTGIWIPKHIFDKAGKFPEHLNFSEDFYWMIKATIHGVQFLKCESISSDGFLYYKRLHPNRLSDKYKDDILQNIPIIRQDLKSYMTEINR